MTLAWPETTSTPSYAGAPALRVGRRMFARLRGEMADHVDELTGTAYGEVLMVGVGSLEEKEMLRAYAEAFGPPPGVPPTDTFEHRPAG